MNVREQPRDVQDFQGFASAAACRGARRRNEAVPVVSICANVCVCMCVYMYVYMYVCVCVVCVVRMCVCVCAGLVGPDPHPEASCKCWRLCQSVMRILI